MKPSKAVLDVVNKRDGRCMYGLLHGGCSEGKDPHHIKSRGSGGGDEPENIITLCRRHHNDAHAGRISKYELYAILTEFYNYQYE